MKINLFVCQIAIMVRSLGALGVTDIPLFSDTYSALIQKPFLCRNLQFFVSPDEDGIFFRSNPSEYGY
jgi:hypothetical protein